MNRQKFLAELSRLLGFMSSWDRQAEMNKYIQMLDTSEDEDGLIELLGTPTKIAIAVANDYKPTPRPGTQPPEPEPETVPEQTQEAAAPETEAERETESESAPPPPPPKKRDELQIVTDGEFEYGMELAILMGEPISAAVESALNGEYLPDPDFSLEEILRETLGDTDAAPAEDGESEPPQGGEQTQPVSAESADMPEAQGEQPEEAQAHTEAEASQGPEPAGDEDAAAAGKAPTEERVPAQAQPQSEAEAETEAQPAADVPEAQPMEDGDSAAAAAEPAPDTAEAEGTADTAGGAEDTDSEVSGEEGPVFDKATAPAPKELISAENAPAPEDVKTPSPELVFDPDKFAELPPDTPSEPDGPEETDGPDRPERPRRELRPAVTAVYILFSLVIGLPVALALILIGVPVLLLGGGIIALTVYAAMNMISLLSMFSDISLVAGAGLAICGVGLLVAWLGLWLSVELGTLWINSVVLRLGRAVCFKKEADGE